MSKALVVVESPTKAKTINRYLGEGYTVLASMGHIRDLPKSKLGVDVDEGFAPVYEAIPARKKVIIGLRAAAKDAKSIYIATDPDREGEAIGWHVVETLGKKRKIERLMFNEITRKAVLAAIKNPGKIDRRMVDAQQARRVLDRLVGYKISPLLWDKVRRGLSAGRVQSVALKVVCDREREIEQFVPEEYWNIFARLAGSSPPDFEAVLVKRGRETLRLKNAEESTAIVSELTDTPFIVKMVTTKERKKHSPPPFITSKLQQAARFPVRKTMMVAQQLYEGVELPGEGLVGLITYMRTDSTRVSDEVLVEVRGYINRTFGSDFVPETPNYYRVKADAQDAHEAIRPTSTSHDPESVRPHLTRDQYSLYRLIWNRFVASQMLPARFDDTTVEISAGEYLFRAKGSVPRFSGWLAVQEVPETELSQEKIGDQTTGTQEDAKEDGATGVLPVLKTKDRLELRILRPEQKFTQPPSRYSEATLVKELEENGIGRPSTYASIIGVLQMREYVDKIEGRFKPRKLGVLVTDLLTKSFEDILDVEYTREMEDLLDKIEAGRADYQSTLASFYKKFSADLKEAVVEMPNIKGEGMPSDELCDKCGSPMVIKVGRFGLFLACSTYPECQNTREHEKTEMGPDDQEEVCENCGKPMVVKRGRFGQFLACSGYPDCKTTRKVISTNRGLTAAKPDEILDERCPRCKSNLVVKQGRFGEFTACTNYPNCKYVRLKGTGVYCPEDGGEIVERKTRRGRAFYGCSNYPDCEFTLWGRPISESCPDCKAPYLVEKITKRHGRQLQCHNDTCSYSRTEELATV